MLVSCITTVLSGLGLVAYAFTDVHTTTQLMSEAGKVGLTLMWMSAAFISHTRK